MKIDRETIKRSFSRAASTYDESSGLQRDVAGELFLRMGSAASSLAYARAQACPAQHPPLKILDIGTGTGSLPALLADGYPGASVAAFDISLEMLKVSREKLVAAGAGLVAAECESIPFIDSIFDVAVSSLTYQWAHDLEKAFTEAGRVLRPGGLFLFSTLGPDTLKELRLCYPSEGYGNMGFKSAEEVEAALSGARLEKVFLETRPFVKTYNGLLELLRTLKAIGASPPLERGKGLTGRKALLDAEKKYREKFSSFGGVIATYDVIFAAARKA